MCGCVVVGVIGLLFFDGDVVLLEVCVVYGVVVLGVKRGVVGAYGERGVVFEIRFDVENV